MKKTFFARRALPILMVVFFAAPFALRGARLAVQSLKNDVKDWLPASFDETSELDWFREHFLGEQFVVASWEGCTGDEDDKRLRMLVDKLFPEIPPSERDNARPDQDGDATNGGPKSYFDETLGLYVRQKQADATDSEPETIGDKLGLYTIGKYDSKGILVHPYENWGLRQEKWLRGRGGKWYYILPNGDLYRWDGGTIPIRSAFRELGRSIFGPKEVEGELVKSLGLDDGPWYYRDPRRLDARLFKTVVTGPAVLHEMTSREPLAVDEPEARDRLAGALFGPDGKQTCLLITLTDEGKEDMRRAVGRGLLGKPRGKLQDLAEEAGIYIPPKPSLIPPPVSWLLPDPPSSPFPELRLGGPAIDNVAIDEEGQVTLVRLVGLSAVLGVLLSWLSFRSFYVTIMVLIVGGLSAIVSLAIVAWSGSTPDAVLMSMPSLVYVLGLSGAVHIVNYYRDAVRENGLRGAPERAVRLGFEPCTLAAITTGVGLLSLTTSNIIPIQKFGFFSAVGVLATLILLFTYLPSALELWPPGFHLGRKQSSDDDTSSGGLHDFVSRFWQSVGQFVIRRHVAVSACGLVVMAVFAIGLTKIDTSIQLLKLFHGEAKIIKDYTWLEGNLGNLVPMELVVRVDPKSMRQDLKDLDAKFQLDFISRIEITKRIQNAIDDEFGADGQGQVGQAMSAATFAPLLLLPVESLGERIERGGTNRRLQRARDQFLASDYFRLEKDTGAELWRISLRLQALSEDDLDYGDFVNDLQSVVEPIMAAYKFRDNILRAVYPKPNDRRIKSVYFAKASPEPLSPSATPLAATDGLEPSVTRRRLEAQSRLFEQTLRDLLRYDRVTVADYDPQLRQPDCIVLLSDKSLYDTEFLTEHAPLLVDASDHRFEPKTGALTAMGEKAEIATVYTGVVPVVYKAQRTLLQSLIRSTVWAFAGIALIMIVVVRSPSAGLISMIPNVFPVVIIFGAMGWKGINVDIGSMMCASVAMGVAVDDTIHFWTWFRRGLDSGLDRLDAIMLSYDRCATAMTQTTLIGGLGLSVFALSTFTPTQRFGVLMLVLMVTALVGDLILLPAILAGPLGRVFARKKTKPKHDQPQMAKDETPQPRPTTAQGPHGALSSGVSTPHTTEAKARQLRQDGAHGRLRK